MSAVRQGVLEYKPCLWCMVTGEDISCSQIAQARLLRGTKMVRRSVLQILRNNIESVLVEIDIARKDRRDSEEESLTDYSLSSRPSFL